MPRFPADESALARMRHTVVATVLEPLAIAGELAAGRHRAAGIPDLLIAAVAERAQLTLVHYDADFEAIAGVTRQAHTWVVPRGSVP